jgi:hypothetical protein
MSDDDLDPNEVVEALMHVKEILDPVIEFAEGMRAQLLERGWSPEVANDVSGEILKRMIVLGMGGSQ